MVDSRGAHPPSLAGRASRAWTASGLHFECARSMPSATLYRAGFYVGLGGGAAGGVWRFLGKFNAGNPVRKHARCGLRDLQVVFLRQKRLPGMWNPKAWQKRQRFVSRGTRRSGTFPERVPLKIAGFQRNSRRPPRHLRHLVDTHRLAWDVSCGRNRPTKTKKSNLKKNRFPELFRFFVNGVFPAELAVFYEFQFLLHGFFVFIGHV